MALEGVPGKVGEYRDTITGEVVYIKEYILVRVIAPYDKDEALRRARGIHGKDGWDVLDSRERPTRLEDGRYEWNFPATKTA